MNLVYSFTRSLDQSISDSIDYPLFDVSNIKEPLRKIQKLTADIAVIVFSTGASIFLLLGLAHLEDRFVRWLSSNRLTGLNAFFLLSISPYLLTGAKIACLIGVTATALFIFESALKAGLDMMPHFRQVKV